MRDCDMEEFSGMLDAVCSMISRGNYTPSAQNTAMWFRSLVAHDISSVRAAFDAHVKDPQRGRFVPVPADLIAQIEGMAADDGRPGPEEAWAISVKASDETETVVWTAEMEQAWHIARSVYENGDDIGARMAFKEAYARMVDASRAARTRAVWGISEGFDTERRAISVQHAISMGRLHVDGVSLLAGPGEKPALLGDLLKSPNVPQHAREAIERFKQRVAEKAIAPGIDGLAKQRTAGLKADSEARVAAYQKESE